MLRSVYFIYIDGNNTSKKEEKKTCANISVGERFSLT